MEEVRALAGHAAIAYQVEVDGTPVTVQFTSDATLYIGGHAFRPDVSAIEGLPLYSLLLDGASYEVVIDEKDGTYYALVRGKVHRIKVSDRTARTSPYATSVSPPSEAVIRAPLCGLVVEVPVTVGQAVEANQVITILESMKMENEILSPRSGIVQEVRVQAGSIVHEGDILVKVG